VGVVGEDSQPFRSWANLLPGANRPIGPWPIRSLELLLPGLLAPWNFRSPERIGSSELSYSGVFAPRNIHSLELSFPVSP